MLGMLLAASFLVAGTLWPAVLAHALLDLLAGLVLGESLIRE
jgi:membrane protease YdiL (CAAX protease family)